MHDTWGWLKWLKWSQICRRMQHFFVQHFGGGCHIYRNLYLTKTSHFNRKNSFFFFLWDHLLGSKPGGGFGRWILPLACELWDPRYGLGRYIEPLDRSFASLSAASSSGGSSPPKKIRLVFGARTSVGIFVIKKNGKCRNRNTEGSCDYDCMMFFLKRWWK